MLDSRMRSERNPRSLLRGQRANLEKDIPSLEDSSQFAARSFKS